MINLFKLVGDIFIDTDKAQDSLQKVDKKATSFGEKLGKGIKTVGKWGMATVGAATAVGGAMLAVDKATEEYRNNMAKLTTAFEATGKTSKQAQNAYKELYKVLGDSDQATEATQLLSNLAKNEQDVSKWADISAGVVGRFGDSLPIESLIEASNETAKVGKVTGSLADALNWVGISEDEFNEKLAKCSTEEQRNTLITETLSKTYKDSSDKFRENNKTILEAREAQAKLQDATGRLGGAIGKLKNRFIGELGPSVANVIGAFADLIKGTDGAKEAFTDTIKKMVENAAEKLPEFVESGLDIIMALLEGIIKAVPSLIKQIPSIIKTLLKAFGKLGGALWDVGADAIAALWRGLKAGWQSVVDWVNEKVNWIRGIFNKNVEQASSAAETRANRKPSGSRRAHASGLPYVPYDAYPASLHRGERVLTAAENREYSAGSNKELITLLKQYLPMIGRQSLVLDTGTLIGEITPGIDNELNRRRRWNG